MISSKDTSGEQFVRRRLTFRVLCGSALLCALVAALAATPTMALQAMELIDRGLEIVRSGGATVFFASMALGPAVGAPISVFSLAAGPLFADRLGMPAVILCSLCAISANMAICHVLARRTFKPALQRLVSLMHVQVPDHHPGGSSALIVLLRVTPGVPFPIQNYVLGLAAVPFWRYQVISSLLVLPLNAALILFGDALLEGKGKNMLLGGMFLGTFLALVHLVRGRYRQPVQPSSLRG